MAKAVAAGKRVVRTRFWVDPEVCTGDHSCMRLSGCPSLTLKPSEDPLRTDPVAHVNNDCVGCGLCGEVAHAAQLCPSFAQIDIIQNPSAWDRLRVRLSRGLIRLLGGRTGAMTPARRRSFPPSDGNGGASAHPPADRRARRRRRRRAGRLDQRGGRRERTCRQPHLDPGCGAAHRRHHLLHRNRAARRRPPPILGLHPAPGQVDILLATELLEAARMVQAGFVTPGRTLVVAADRRVYATDEKVAMGDGRVAEDQLRGAVEGFAQRLVLADLAATAASSGSQLNVVMLGVLAGLQALPIEADAFRATIRAEGKAVDANLRGFEAGLAVAIDPTRHPGGRRPGGGHPGSAAIANLAAVPDSLAPTEGRVSASGMTGDGRTGALPSEARAVLREGDGAARRLPERGLCAALPRAAAAHLPARRGADGAFMRELARHLAVRMSVEDVIRVAQLKLRETRLARVTREAQARQGDIVDITEYMKPGPEEVLGLLPPALGAGRCGACGTTAPGR